MAESVEVTSPAAGAGEELLNLAEAAQLLGISQRTVQRLLERGELKGTKVGRQWRFRKGDLAAYLEREPVAIALPPWEDVDRAQESLAGWVEAVTLEISTLSGESEEGEGLVPEPVAGIAHRIVQQAIRDGVSDLHVEPGPGSMRVRFRVDGVLHLVTSLPMSLHPALVARYKQMAEMNLGEQRLPQDGTFSARYEGKEYEFRVNCWPTLRGEKIVMRIVDRASVLIDLEKLAFFPEMLARVETLIAKPRGIFFVTGPTGTGKSTTLYCMLHRLNTDAKNITTVEDPIEYELPGVNQIAMNPMLGITFPTALRGVMRQDPDILMVAEIRDMETLQMAFEAALAGHLVLSVMHANDAPAAVHRLLDVGMNRVSVATAFLGMLAQRLARRLCPACRQPAELSAAVLDEVRQRASAGGLLLPRDATFYRAVGCERCHRTGYHGRIGLFELMEAGPEIREAVARGASIDELRALAVRHGMHTLAVDGILKALEGRTTVEEVLRVL